MTLQDVLIQDEGLKLKPYLDCCGKPWKECVCVNKGNMTLGIGTNLDEGITQPEAVFLCLNRVQIAKTEAAKIPCFAGLDPVRQDVMTMMIFNMGAPRFAGFVNLMAAIERKDFNTAASQMLASRWAAEVGKRATRLAEMMRSGVYQT